MKLRWNAARSGEISGTVVKKTSTSGIPHRFTPASIQITAAAIPQAANNYARGGRLPRSRRFSHRAANRAVETGLAPFLRRHDSRSLGSEKGSCPWKDERYCTTRIYEGDYAYEIEQVLDPATQVSLGWRYHIYRVRPREELLRSGQASTREQAEESGKRMLAEVVRKERRAESTRNKPAA
jgi:hypothetical protein